MHPNYPNPFNPATRVAFDLPAAARVSLTVFDVKGSRVATVLDERRSAGHHTVAWNGRDDAGRQVSSGVYFYQLRAGDFRATRRMLLMR